ncbi:MULTISPECIES: hypothetical protein [unclassified Leptolyngbya]|uniref:hypothetical protein n=1 Tax=unclassified Leptolyngbya TaxID=2650499 RepID=UPI001685A77F|nr:MULTISPECIES: hypothetical protein [unclassified Leptolyngbya]MBD1910063.1 hypothetical protein [Leptolyngbya sp. FACHB-8]MBD2158736.1 hypothetical protein [Leptolyngbya sp. FACHB-16]
MSDATFSRDEMTQLAAAVMVTGMAVSMVDVGIVSSAIEATAMGQEIAAASERYPNNAIIQALFSQEAVKQAREEGSLNVQLTPDEVKPETVVDTAIARIQAALAVLSSKASPEDIQQYKEFIYSCAERVAKAAGSGLFGSGSTKVSDKEAIALERIKAVLAL